MSEHDGVDDSTIELGKLAQRISRGKNRDKLLALVSEEDPNLILPEVQTRKLVDERAAKLQEKIDKLEQEREADKRLSALAEKRRAIKEAHGLRDEDLKEVEKIMVDKGIATHETAIEFRKLNSRVATPTPSSYNAVELPTTKELLENPKQWARSEAHKALDDFRAGKI